MADDKVKEQVDKLREQLKIQHNELDKETDVSLVRKRMRTIQELQDKIDELLKSNLVGHSTKNKTIVFNESSRSALQKELELIGDKLKSITEPKVREAFENRKKQIEDFLSGEGEEPKEEPLTRQAKNILNKSKNYDESKTTLKNPFAKQKSAGEKLAELQLKRLQNQITKERTPKFGFPEITKEQSTGIVIASILATFFILAGMGTKFSQLWGYAFNAPISKGSGPGEPDDSWDIPNPFHGIAS